VLKVTLNTNQLSN